MGNEWFGKVDEALKEKLKNCRNEAEMRAAIAGSGMELSDDLLDSVTGGLLDIVRCIER